MTKLKTWLDLAPSPDADWPSHQPITLTELVAEARALDWDFTNWCCASGYDASNPEARRVFDCLLAYARRNRCRPHDCQGDDEGRRGSEDRPAARRDPQ
jgi:hypothetical protein